MRLGISGAVVAAVLLMALAEASAQSNGGVVYGMFGPRNLGGGLQPVPRSTVNGIITAPSGMFVGRGRATGTTFNPSVWQAPIAQQTQQAVNLQLGEANQLLAQQQLAQQQQLGAAQAAPVGVPPEQWFRAPVVNPGGINPAGAMLQAPMNQAAPMGPAVIGPGAETAPVNAGAIYAVPVGAAPFTAQRPVVAAGFVAPELPGSPAAQLAALINRTPRISKVSPISVTTENGVTVLRGIVRSTHDWQLAGDMARMEPGVWDVRNDIMVGTPVLPAVPVAAPR